MAAPESLVRLLAPWAELYGDSTPIATLIVFGHLAALLFAGGLAVTLDRATLRIWNGAREARSAQLVALRGAHRVVLTGLTASVVTGLLLFASDVETYFVSPIFWTKMVLVLLLLTNGYRMTRIEARLAVAAEEVDATWARLRRSAMVSVALWFAITFVGVALVNA